MEASVKLFVFILTMVCFIMAIAPPWKRLEDHNGENWIGYWIKMIWAALAFWGTSLFTLLLKKG